MTLFALTASAQSGLVARYYLNGNANDAVGTNHGTVVGAVPTTDRFGTPNAAYLFNGSSSRIEFPGPPVPFQHTNWTIAAWVKSASLSQAGMAVYVGSDNGIGSDGFGFGFNGSAVLQGFFPDMAQGWVSTGASISGTSQWAHVVMLRTNGVTSFYLNGVQTPNTTSLPTRAPTDFTIGSQNGLRYFNGSIDDVRIYNRAISTNEVMQIYTNSPEFCSPHAATATATLAGMFVVGATITDGGCGYTNNPLVTIQGGGGSNATATATVTNGQVVAVNITGAGTGYTNPPNIIIGGPPFAPSLSIRFSKVKVTQHLSIGHNYVLEGTTNFVTWTPVGPQFTAQAATVETEVDLDLMGRYFRIREVP